jgi:polyisoprenoid-binding protein YceI
MAGAVAAILPRRTAAQDRSWRFGPEAGRISFTARHLGLFSSTGQFERFRAIVTLDPRNLEDARVEAVVETAAISHPWPAAGPLLRSASFFDSERFPEARFTGRASGVSDRGAFPVEGTLWVRGIERSFAMRARLVTRGRDQAVGRDVADFEAEGELDRTQFGMAAERDVISDLIALAVRVRLLL